MSPKPLAQAAAAQGACVGQRNRSFTRASVRCTAQLQDFLHSQLCSPTLARTAVLELGTVTAFTVSPGCDHAPTAARGSIYRWSGSIDCLPEPVDHQSVAFVLRSHAGPQPGKATRKRTRGWRCAGWWHARGEGPLPHSSFQSVAARHAIWPAFRRLLMRPGEEWRCGDLRIAQASCAQASSKQRPADWRTA